MSSYQEKCRRTGRTTRMIQAAVAYAVTGKPASIVVGYQSDVGVFRDMIWKLYGAWPPNLEVVSWLAVAPNSAFAEQIYGIKLSEDHHLHGKLFYDHSVFEKNFSSMLAAYHAYDQNLAPVAEVVDQGDDLQIKWTTEDPDMHFGSGSVLYGVLK